MKFYWIEKTMVITNPAVYVEVKNTCSYTSICLHGVVFSGIQGYAFMTHYTAVPFLSYGLWYIVPIRNM
jgi:hypothetical protein